ncbi:DUF4174 domain-containing protein [Tropicimonas sp. IMCC34011]|uniref:DUF4174 domain-containing protein n=1 Tax=Tropicimonas sp. IMCC34011 TaxID=2248759 RepID=UPI000E260088|nr:DUF4174 domain-containing protein [Tropicimonas sp. IMCC34011]
MHVHATIRLLALAGALFLTGGSVLSAQTDAPEGEDALAVGADPLPEDAPEPPDADLPLEIRDAADIDLSDYLWTRRPIVVFADTPADPRFLEQVELLSARPEELISRDVIVVTDTDPGARSGVRSQLRPRGFALVIMGKDGRVELRKPFPWDVREISRTIDKMPLRQNELREQRNGGS